MLKQLRGIEGVVELVDAVEDGKYYYLVTRYESRGDLFEFLVQQPEKLLESRVQVIFKSIVESLSKVHQLGICHLDLSLENVLLSETGEIRIGDFGVARSVGEPHGSGNTRVGKPKYMAPEIAADMQYDGFKADVYSLGVVLFCLMYGVHPYDAPSWDNVSFALIEAGCFQDVLALNQFKGLRSPQVKELLSMMLAPEDERCDLGAIMALPWMTKVPNN